MIEKVWVYEPGDEVYTQAANGLLTIWQVNEDGTLRPLVTQHLSPRREQEQP